jgi:hypothetical protein
MSIVTSNTHKVVDGDLLDDALRVNDEQVACSPHKPKASPKQHEISVTTVTLGHYVGSNLASSCSGKICWTMPLVNQ